MDESTATAAAAGGEPIVNAEPPGTPATAKKAPAAKKAATAKKAPAKKAAAKKAAARPRRPAKKADREEGAHQARDRQAGGRARPHRRAR